MQSNYIFKNLIKTGYPPPPFPPPGDRSGFKQEIGVIPSPTRAWRRSPVARLEEDGGGVLLARTGGDSGPQTLGSLQEYAPPSPSSGVCLPGCVSDCVCITALYKQKLTHIGAASDPGQGAGRGHISSCNTFRATYIWKKLSHCVMKPCVLG